MRKCPPLADVLLLPRITKSRASAPTIVLALWIMSMSMSKATIGEAAQQANAGANSTKAPPTNSQQPQAGPALVPALFVFGDSLVDDGNNNFIPSLARSNFYPYGIDFPLGATGRFCNGRTVADVVGEFLGVPFLPAYLNPATKGSAIAHGVNYASAAGGILDTSGRNYVGHLSFNMQIKNFKNTRQELTALLGGEDTTSEFLAKSIFAIVFGSNDYLNNYLINSTGYSKQYTPNGYRELVTELFAKQLVTLYGLGARRFIIAGVGPLGCIPNVLATKSKDGRCVGYINQLVQGFNAQVLQLVNELNSDPDLVGATFLYAKIYHMFSSIIANPRKYGFTVTNMGCCGIGRNRGQLTCLPPIAELCPNRQQHVFWDAFHPTEATNIILASSIFNGDASSVVPMNLRELLSQG